MIKKGKGITCNHCGGHIRMATKEDLKHKKHYCDEDCRNHIPRERMK